MTMPNEAEKIYRTLFKKEMPAVLRERYDAASEKLLRSFSQEQKDELDRLAKSNVDLEALEMAARYTGRYPLLSLKFRMMVHLAETLPENRSQYINVKNRRLVAFLSIGWGVLLSSLRLLKGLILLRIVRHV